MLPPASSAQTGDLIAIRLHATLKGCCHSSRICDLPKICAAVALADVPSSMHGIMAPIVGILPVAALVSLLIHLCSSSNARSSSPPAGVLYRSSSPNEWQVPPFHCVAMVHDRHLAYFMCSTSHGDECMRDTLRCAINLCLLTAAPREVIAVKAPSDRNFAPSITT